MARPKMNIPGMSAYLCLNVMSCCRSVLNLSFRFAKGCRINVCSVKSTDFAMIYFIL